jgi:hypothetical protein
MINIWDVSSALAVIVLVAAWVVRHYRIGWKCGNSSCKPTDCGGCSRSSKE